MIYFVFQYSMIISLEEEKLLTLFGQKYLEIANNPDREKVEPSKIERLKPIQNRLIIFNPSYPHRVSPIHKGKRRAIIVNAWPKKPYTFENSESYSSYNI